MFDRTCKVFDKMLQREKEKEAAIEESFQASCIEKWIIELTNGDADHVHLYTKILHTNIISN